MDQADRIHQQKVVVIRLPANFQGRTNCLATTAAAAGGGAGNSQADGPQLADINQIPDEIIAEMVSNQYKQQQEHPIDAPQGAAIDPNMMIDNSDPKQMAMYGVDHPELAPTAPNASSSTSGHMTYSRGSKHSNHTTTNSTSNSNSNTFTLKPTTAAAAAAVVAAIGNQQQQQQTSNSMSEAVGQGEGATKTAAAAAAGGEEDEKVQYKNYSPKQREWMLVVLSYSRGLLGKPFEMKLQDVVIEKARDVLRANAETFKLTNRIPTPKTLRGVWSNLWKHEDRTVGVVRKGGRPRIDPAIKRRNRNEREKRRRAAKRQDKDSMEGPHGGDFANGSGRAGGGGYYHQLDQQSSGMARRSQRGH